MMANQSLTTKASSRASRSPDASSSGRLTWWLGGSALISWWLYVALTWISRHFAYEVPGADRPLVPVLAIFAALFGLYLVQVALTKRIAEEHTAMPLIVVFSIAFRLLLLFSEPIQEVDAYRYLWDGKSLAAGISPFPYSPEHILTANANHDHPADVKQLIQLRDQTAANAQILSRVHFGHLTTVYPPVSQAVFGAAALVTPNSTSVQNHLLVIKTFIVAFDLATFGFLILILRYVGRPPEWSMAYGWCPLAMKEFANSGHLDSITVFLSVATAYCALRAFYPHPAADHSSLAAPSKKSAYQWTFLTAIVLSLAVGAKIYPIILAPLLFLSAWKKVGRFAAMSAAIIVLTLTIVMVTPMLSRDQPQPQLSVDPEAASDSLPPLPMMLDSTEPTAEASQSPTNEPNLALSTPNDTAPRLPESERAESERAESPITDRTAAKDSGPPSPNMDPPQTGLSAFASQWQMNDFLFLLVTENLRGANQGSTAWFTITPEKWREFVVSSVAENTSLRRGQVPFLTTRLLTSVAFAILATWLAWRTMSSPNPEEWLRTVFLTIAWFWLLQPTQNPWYWTWALPFIPFARSRAWLAVSGLVLIYYARFWFSYHADKNPIAGTPYVGVTFFDYVITWLEFGPWFLWLIWTAVSHKPTDQ